MPQTISVPPHRPLAEADYTPADRRDLDRWEALQPDNEGELPKVTFNSAA
ncbi:hypothetical protein AB0M11_26520 [Streptomyces sp. NPDC051987]